ncbi:antirestriction protein ArdA [Paracoccus sp. M683]|uniref:antirestriction protein ArdA n=1 Tax=Paracoccus sp. M683 TaxID=2594268 RepID=UPI00117E2144|nr:antirestriction protein ArdA [Paracoccus sp. M683]TRW96277.1 antirestriction protein ArdA [Paracoccus sp. M683]
MEEDQGTIRIYVACLAAYNNGILHGRWIAASREAYDIYADIRAMLAASPIEDAEEWAIHDHEGFEGAEVSEYMGIEQVAELAAFIEEHGEIGGKLVGHFGNLDEARKAIEDAYAGEYRSLADFAEELTEETGDIPERLRFYIDYDRMARDMEIGDVFTIETGFEQVHVFWSH